MGPKSAEKSVQGFGAASLCVQVELESFEKPKIQALKSQGSSSLGCLYKDPNKDPSSAFIVGEILFSSASQPRKE